MESPQDAANMGIGPANEATMILIVCGGRDYNNLAAVEHALYVVHAKKGITLLVEGGARGADQLARAWAIKNGVPHKTEEADWRTHGRAAGPIRNGLMLAKYKPDGVVAFPGGSGTADMMAQARAAGVKVWEPCKPR
jgi:predicted Rossmann-fold nucleotide-binding protein